MAGALAPVVRYVVMDNGVISPGAKAFFYLSGTSTPHNVFNNADLAPGHEHTNPVIADAEGVLPVIYFDAVAYRVLMTDSAGATIFPAQDNVYDLFEVFAATPVAANLVYAGPFSGADAIPTFRALVDADLPSDARWTTLSTTATGTQNNLAIGDATIVLCNNATDLTITGFSAQPLVPGKPVTFVSIGAGAVYFLNQNASSDAANRLITHVSNFNVGLAAGVGRAVFTYDLTTTRFRLVQHEQGGYIAYTPTWSNSGTANTLGDGTLSGFYYLRGRQVQFIVSLLWGTTTASGNGEWRFLLPGTVNLSIVQVGQNQSFDTSVPARFAGMNILQSSTTIAPVVDNSTAGGALQGVTATVPMTWAVGDLINAWGFVGAT